MCKMNILVSDRTLLHCLFKQIWILINVPSFLAVSLISLQHIPCLCFTLSLLKAFQLLSGSNHCRRSHRYERWARWIHHTARPMLTPQSAQRRRLPPLQMGLGAFLLCTLTFHSEKTFPMNLNCFWTTLARGGVECSGRFHCMKYFNSEVRHRGLASGAAAVKTILTLPTHC